MRYHIDTIPVWDALKLEGECALCSLRRKTELGETGRYLGASVMEPDVRIRVNAKGFCRRHQQMLFGFENRLGHALMLQTHLKEVWSQIGKAQRTAASGKTGLLKGRSNEKQALRRTAESIRAIADGCVLCDSIEEEMKRYTHTFLYLYQSDSEFQRRFLASKGVCLPDMALLLETAAEEFSARDARSFADALFQLQEKNIARTQEDVDWFIKKFDYRFSKEPWKNSRYAVERAVNKLQGWCVGEEPLPKEQKA